MSMHKVRNPFYCCKGQFYDKGFHGQVLAVGIDQRTLSGAGDTYRFTIGNNPTIYEGLKSEILRVAHRWTNPFGKMVLITPVDLFTKHDLSA